MTFRSDGMRAELKATEDAIYAGWPSRAYWHASNLAHMVFNMYPELRVHAPKINWQQEEEHR